MRFFKQLFITSVLFSFTFPFTLSAMENRNPYNLVLVPGIYNGGCSGVAEYIFSTRATITLNEKSYSRCKNEYLFNEKELYKTPGIIFIEDGSNLKNKTTWAILRADLGGSNCQHYFEKQWEKDTQIDKNEKAVFCGGSQGCATVLYWASKQSKEEQKKLVGALILEGPLTNGNSAILHTCAHYITVLKPVAYLPFSRFWLPWAAKIVLPYYNPLRTQPIHAAKKIDHVIPIILMHNENDPLISINDTRKAYCVLKENGNNVYLFESNVKNKNPMDNHVEFLSHETETQRLRKEFVIKHIIINNSVKDLGTGYVQSYQPAIDIVKKEINQSSWKSRYLRNTIDIAAAWAIGTYIAYKYMYKNPAFYALFNR